MNVTIRWRGDGTGRVTRVGPPIRHLPRCNFCQAIIRKGSIHGWRVCHQEDKP